MVQQFITCTEICEVNQSTHDKNSFKMKSGINTPFPDNDTCNVQKTQICSMVTKTYS